MKERKKNMGWQNDTEKLKKRNLVVVPRLRTGYSRATHNKMEETPDPDCPFCCAKLTLAHILWQCNSETEEEKRKSKKMKELWEKGEQGAKMLRTIDTKTQIGTKKERTRNDEKTANEQGKG
jgi:hypothetical protein